MPSHTDLPLEPLDVLIMGAGVSGIGAAAYLRRDQPHKVIAILESREQMGGTGICSVIRVFVRTRICIPLVLTLNPDESQISGRCVGHSRVSARNH